MPYIKQEARERLHEEGNAHPQDAGELNYCISVFCNEYLQHRGITYKNINEVIGVLECAKLELYARIARPYETQKCYDNGDVYKCLN